MKDEGALVYYDVFKKEKENIKYPVPWADSSSISFLEKTNIVDHILYNLGFIKLETTNHTLKAKQILIIVRNKLKKNEPPVIGLHLLMGNSIKKRLKNVLKSIEKNKIELQSGIYKKKSAEPDKRRLS